ncbi:MAG: helix-turn-helix domain-containing protein [Burkholderiales bacterium]|nr:helix-turn-helix domain-containing protein [Burkholderiales bacterium]
MSETAAMVNGLKRVLKARRINYAQVAEALGLSEATVKRMFSKQEFSMHRFEQVCQLAEVKLIELAKEASSEKNYVSQLTEEQERRILGDTKLFIVAVCVLNHLTLEQIVSIYDISESECIRLLLELDRIRFLQLFPNNRIKLLVSRTFSWRPNGPILHYVKATGAEDYFRSRFDGAGEHVTLINALLSAASSAQIIHQLKRIGRDFAERHDDDKHLPLGERRPASLLLAIRPWEPEAFKKLRRPSPRV